MKVLFIILICFQDFVVVGLTSITEVCPIPNSSVNIFRSLSKAEGFNIQFIIFFQGIPSLL